jgi:ribosomal protein L33
MMGSWGSSREDEEGDKEDFEPVPSFSKVHPVCKTVKSFLYVHNKHGEQNTLNLELVLFCLKCKASI